MIFNCTILANFALQASVWPLHYNIWVYTGWDKSAPFIKYYLFYSYSLKGTVLPSLSELSFAFKLLCFKPEVPQSPGFKSRQAG